MKKILFLWCCMIQFAAAQTPAVKALQVGDTIPNFLFENLMQVKSTANPKQSNQIQAKPAYEKGLLILNFWATWCIPCVRELPRFSKLQKQYASSFQMININYESKEKIRTYLDQHSELVNLNFMSSKAYNGYFPHRTLPTNIWIDRHGVIKAYTDDHAISETAIADFISGKAFPETQTEDLTFDYNKPYQVKDGAFLRKSIFTGYNPQIRNGGTRYANYDSIPKRYLAWNLSKSNLIWSSISGIGYLRNYDLNFIEIHSKDVSSFLYPAEADSGQIVNSKMYYKNMFCYELIINEKMDLPTFYNEMAKEVCNFFNVHAYMKDKLTDCWVIQKKENAQHIPPSIHPERTPLRIKNYIFIAEHLTIKDLANEFTRMYGSEPPFIDETGIVYQIDFKKDFSSQPGDLTVEKLKQAFEDMGLSLTLQKRKYPHLVIEDLN